MVTSSPRHRGFVDTNVVIQLALLSAVTLAELSAGPHHAGDDPVERARRTSVLQHAEATFEPLPFDAAAARSFGLVCAAVIAVGGKPRARFADLMIAAVAAAHGLPVYTTNPDDFVGLEQLIAVESVPRRR